ncbi:hypothetical protein E2C01_025066 [Portunus trituberculatus]|uniref:Uncharacterized protein n=1 Tax=Portunus trituberculatus TaxID=210409 RepID=A0A5B7EE33_PORTR|nr:hypothetical protein [Portunus trituberculatus]
MCSLLVHLCALLLNKLIFTGIEFSWDKVVYSNSMGPSKWYSHRKKLGTIPIDTQIPSSNCSPVP